MCEKLTSRDGGMCYMYVAPCWWLHEATNSAQAWLCIACELIGLDVLSTLYYQDPARSQLYSRTRILFGLQHRKADGQKNVGGKMMSLAQYRMVCHKPSTLWMVDILRLFVPVEKKQRLGRWVCTRAMLSSHQGAHLISTRCLCQSRK